MQTKMQTSRESTNAKAVFENWDLLARLRGEKPLIHCITNYVTANDVANMLLAAGASPVMADGRQEVAEITRLSRGLVLNIGTLQEHAVESMLLAGKRAAASGHPVILDPVGAGASAYRTETAGRLMAEIPCTVIRGNASEIRTLAGVSAFSGGVDADVRDKVNESNLAAVTEMLNGLSRRSGAVIVMTGETDLIADEARVCMVRNGHPMMTGITGTGCMMDGILAAFQTAGANNAGVMMPDSVFWQSVYAVAAVGICGERAYEKTAAGGGGTGTFRMHFIDAMSGLTDDDIRGGVKIEF